MMRTLLTRTAVAVTGLSVLAGSTAASQLSGADGGAAQQAEFGFPSGLVIGPDGRVYMADRGAHRVFAIDAATGEVETIAGTGVEGFSGDGGAAIQADFRNPEWVEFDPDGNLLIADRGNHRVRRVDATTGVVETIAGTGENLSAGDGGPAVEASLTNPFGLAVDETGAIYVFDTEAHSIRRIDPVTNTITTVVGTGERGYSGDGGPGTQATLARPHNGTFDAEGRLVFGDSFNLRIRLWDPDTGIIETIAGTGTRGVSPPGTLATEADFTFFGGILFEADGSLVYTGLEDRVMRIRASDGRLELVGGTAVRGFGGDGGPAIEAQMQTPYGIVRLPNGDFVFSDGGNGRVRVIYAATGRIDTLAGG